jgi:uncharacterized RmlC-like cupin family protein
MVISINKPYFYHSTANRVNRLKRQDGYTLASSEMGAYMSSFQSGPVPGLRIVRSGELDSNTPQTPGMTRAEAISYARVGAQKLWAGTVVVHPNAKTGPHHHGELETVIYIVRGRARFRWGEHLEFVDEAGPGDFVYVPPFAPHQELNARKDQPVEAVIVRSGQEPVVVNLDIPSPEDETDALGSDPFHSNAS